MEVNLLKVIEDVSEHKHFHFRWFSYKDCHTDFFSRNIAYRFILADESTGILLEEKVYLEGLLYKNMIIYNLTNIEKKSTHVK